MLIEVESGTYTGSAHRHNGYYAGDFSGRRAGRTAQSSDAADRSQLAVAC